MGWPFFLIRMGNPGALRTLTIRGNFSYMDFTSFLGLLILLVNFMIFNHLTHCRNSVYPLTL